MPENMRYFGLCMSCRNASSCTFPRDPAKPSFYCEEFEVEPAVSIVKSPKEQSSVTGLFADKDLTKFIGLCSDCEGRESCTFPKPEGGIWRCEEYQQNKGKSSALSQTNPIFTQMKGSSISEFDRHLKNPGKAY